MTRVGRIDTDQQIRQHVLFLLVELVRRAVLVTEELVRRRLISETLGLPVPLEVGLGPVSDVRDERRGSAAVARLDVAIGGLPAPHTVEEVARVQRRRVALAVNLPRLEQRLGP